MSRYIKKCTIPNRMIPKQKNDLKKDTKAGYCILPKNFVINNKYKIIKKLGQGGFSIVYLVENITTHDYFAIKISISKEKREDKYNEVGNEVAKFALVQDSEYFVQMIDSFDFSNNRMIYKCIVMELVGCNVLQIIQKYEYKGLPNILVKNILREVTLGLQFLNSKNLGHFDLKPENICLAMSPADAKKFGDESKDHESQCEFFKNVSCDIKIKIIDLGGIIDTTTNLEYLPTTLEYIAYEGLIKGNNKTYDNNYHMFSLGCILYELITGNMLIKLKQGKYHNIVEHIHQIRRFFSSEVLTIVDTIIGVNSEIETERGKFDLCTKITMETQNNMLIPEDLKLLNDLLINMLCPNPETRIKPAEILTSEWLNTSIDLHYKYLKYKDKYLKLKNILST